MNTIRLKNVFRQHKSSSGGNNHNKQSNNSGSSSSNNNNCTEEGETFFSATFSEQEAIDNTTKTEPPVDVGRGGGGGGGSMRNLVAAAVSTKSLFSIIRPMRASSSSSDLTDNPTTTISSSHESTAKKKGNLKRNSSNGDADNNNTNNNNNRRSAMMKPQAASLSFLAPMNTNFETNLGSAAAAAAAASSSSSSSDFQFWKQQDAAAAAAAAPSTPTSSPRKMGKKPLSLRTLNPRILLSKKKPNEANNNASFQAMADNSSVLTPLSRHSSAFSPGTLSLSGGSRSGGGGGFQRMPLKKPSMDPSSSMANNSNHPNNHMGKPLVMLFEPKRINSVTSELTTPFTPPVSNIVQASYDGYDGEEEQQHQQQQHEDYDHDNASHDVRVSHQGQDVVISRGRSFLRRGGGGGGGDNHKELSQSQHNLLSTSGPKSIWGSYPRLFSRSKSAENLEKESLDHGLGPEIHFSLKKKTPSLEQPSFSRLSSLSQEQSSSTTNSGSSLFWAPLKKPSMDPSSRLSSLSQEQHQQQQQRSSTSHNGSPGLEMQPSRDHYPSSSSDNMVPAIFEHPTGGGLEEFIVKVNTTNGPPREGLRRMLSTTSALTMSSALTGARRMLSTTSACTISTALTGHSDIISVAQPSSSSSSPQKIASTQTPPSPPSKQFQQDIVLGPTNRPSVKDMDEEYIKVSIRGMDVLVSPKKNADDDDDDDHDGDGDDKNKVETQEVPLFANTNKHFPLVAAKSHSLTMEDIQKQRFSQSSSFPKKGYLVQNDSWQSNSTWDSVHSHLTTTTAKLLPPSASATPNIPSVIAESPTTTTTTTDGEWNQKSSASGIWGACHDKDSSHLHPSYDQGQKQQQQQQQQQQEEEQQEENEEANPETITNTLKKRYSLKSIASAVAMVKSLANKKKEDNEEEEEEDKKESQMKEVDSAVSRLRANRRKLEDWNEQQRSQRSLVSSQSMESFDDLHKVDNDKDEPHQHFAKSDSNLGMDLDLDEEEPKAIFKKLSQEQTLLNEKINKYQTKSKAALQAEQEATGLKKKHRYHRKSSSQDLMGGNDEQNQGEGSRKSATELLMEVVKDSSQEHKLFEKILANVSQEVDYETELKGESVKSARKEEEKQRRTKRRSRSHEGLPHRSRSGERLGTGKSPTASPQALKKRISGEGLPHRSRSGERLGTGKSPTASPQTLKKRISGKGDVKGGQTRNEEIMTAYGDQPRRSRSLDGRNYLSKQGSSRYSSNRGRSDSRSRPQRRRPSSDRLLGNDTRTSAERRRIRASSNERLVDSSSQSRQQKDRVSSLGDLRKSRSKDRLKDPSSAKKPSHGRQHSASRSTRQLSKEAPTHNPKVRSKPSRQESNSALTLSRHGELQRKTKSSSRKNGLSSSCHNPLERTDRRHSSREKGRIRSSSLNKKRSNARQEDGSKEKRRTTRKVPKGGRREMLKSGGVQKKGPTLTLEDQIHVSDISSSGEESSGEESSMSSSPVLARASKKPIAFHQSMPNIDMDYTFDT